MYRVYPETVCGGVCKFDLVYDRFWVPEEFAVR